MCGVRDDRLVVDHDHATALIRGLLCRSCNGLEAYGGRASFDVYHACPPAAVLGIRERYRDPINGFAEPAEEADGDVWRDNATAWLGL